MPVGPGRRSFACRSTRWSDTPPEPQPLLSPALATAVFLAAAAGELPTPFQAQIDDPLLQPLAPADQEVTSWDEALRLLQERSTDDRTALATVEQASARARQALSTLLPNARFTASMTVDVLHPNVPTLSGGSALPAVAGPSAPLATGVGSLNQSIVDVSAWRGLSAAKASERFAQANLEEVRRQLTQRLVASLVSVAAAERVAQLNREGLRLALEREALTERTRQIGTATELDVVRVRQDVEVARGLVIAGDEQVRRTRDALGLALGLDHGAGLSPSFALNGLVSEAQTACKVLPDPNDRPDLVALRAQEDAARLSRLQALAGYYPTLGLQSALFGYTTDPGFARVASWTVSAVLTVPLWEGGFRGAQVREREATRVQAQEAVERARRSVSVEVSRARRNVEVAQRLLATAVEARALAARTDEMTRRSFEVGRAGSLELVQSAAALRQADVTLASREYESVQARADAFLTEARCDW